jgi:predicted HTH domain antitoxin
MLQANDFVRANLYKSERDVIADALRYLLRARPDLRIQIAIYRYQQDGLSLAKTAELTGVSWQQMKEILLEHGIQPQFGATSAEDLADEVESLREHFRNRAVV